MPHKYSVLTAALVGAWMVSHAGQPVLAEAAKPGTAVAPLAVAAKLAEKTALVTGLQEPQGIVRDSSGNLLIAEYKGGQISRYSLDGKPLGTLVTGLKSPALMVSQGKDVYVTERKANRIIKVDGKGKVTPVGGEVVEPLGITQDGQGNWFVVAHTTSRILRLNKNTWQPVYEAPDEEGEKRYGYRCLASDGGTLLLSDEISGNLFMLTPNGRLATWATGINNPSGIALGPDGAVYATDEGLGGRLLKLAANGTPTVVAEGLGRPRGLLFLDAKTVLVTDRSGTLWKVTLP